MGRRSPRSRVEHGLDAIPAERRARGGVRDIMFVYATFRELNRFFHQPTHYPTRQAIEQFSTSEGRGLDVIDVCLFDKLAAMLPEDLISCVPSLTKPRPARQFVHVTTPPSRQQHGRTYEYTSIRSQVEYGLATIPDDRRELVSARDLVFVARLLAELAGFLGNPASWPTLREFERHLGHIRGRSAGFIRLIGDAYYRKTFEMLPPDIGCAVEYGERFEHSQCGPYFYAWE